MDKSVHDHVEEMITNRLTRRFPDDHFVSQEEFRTIAGSLEGEIDSILSAVSIPGFTEEDLISFYLMKVHQMMRRGMMDNYIEGKRYHKFFSIAFKNLSRDILRMHERAVRKGLRVDPIDTLWDRELDDEWESSYVKMTRAYD